MHINGTHETTPGYLPGVEAKQLMKACITKVRPCGSLSGRAEKSPRIKNGAKESRTPDLLHAMQALYQLSYGPMMSIMLSALNHDGRKAIALADIARPTP